MKLQLLSYVTSLFNNKVTEDMAIQTGESQGNIQQALEHIVPVIMRGFAAKSAEGQEKTDQILQLAWEANDSSWWQHISNFFSQSDMLDKGKAILHDLFGGSDNMQRISESVARKTNIKTSSAETLLQMAAPLCLGAIGKQAGEEGMDAGKLATWFASQKIELDGVPAMTATGAAAVSKTKEQGPAQNPVLTEDKKRSNLWPLLLALLIIGGLAWYFLRGCKPDASVIPDADSMTVPATTTVTPETHIVAPSFKIDADSTVVYAYGDMITLTLPDKNTLTVPNNGAEALLYTKIQQAIQNGLDTTEAGKASGWINLYDVQFTKGLSLRKGAQEQVQHITTLLKAYPQISIKIGGYTDATGAPELNKKLSQQRAEMVAKSLSDLGLTAQVSGAEGYGPEFPVADNATAEGRAQNRRVSCRITAVHP